MGIKLIGITGKARSGKDTFARTLVDEHGFRRMAFADPLKAAASIIFSWPLEDVFNDEFKTHFSPYWDTTVRSALQKLGTEAIRGTFGNDHWVKRWVLDYAPISESCSVVVTDVREEIEAAAIRKFGGLIVHLKRDEAGLEGEESNHSSENGIKVHKDDITIKNNGSLLELAANAFAVVQFIEERGAEFGFRNVDAKV